MRAFLSGAGLVFGVLAVLAVNGCGSSTTNPTDCAKGLKWCETLKGCHECCITKDCTDKGAAFKDFTCVPKDPAATKKEYVCAAPCAAAGTPCAADEGICCAGLVCDTAFDKKCVAKCTADADCKTSHPSDPNKDILFCDTTNGKCGLKICGKDSECPPSTNCVEGRCIMTPNVKSCTLSPTKLVVQTGTKSTLAATAYTTSGSVLTKATYTWASVDSNIASVATTGEVTGGANTGTTKVSATVSGSSPVVKCEAEVLNYATVTSGLRVLVIDEVSYAAVQGAKVYVGSETPIDTDALGTATFANVNPTAGVDITVKGPTHIILTTKGVTKNNVILYVGRKPEQNKAGGYQGKMDFTPAPCYSDWVKFPADPCTVSLGLSGMSISGNIFNLDFNLLLGGNIKTSFLGQTVPLPAGIVFGLAGQMYKEKFYATGSPGTRALWALGGRVGQQFTMDIVTGIIGGGGDVDVGKIVVTLLPLFNNFANSVVSGMSVESKPYVVDSDDRNGNDKTDDLRPDYDNFTTMASINKDPLPLNVKMDKSVDVKIGALPKIGNVFVFDGVLVLGGVIVKGQGMVPLGLTAALDTNDAKADPPDGKIAGDLITVKVSELAGRVPEAAAQRLIIVLALNVASLTGGTGGPITMAGQVFFLDSFDNKTGANAIQGGSFKLPATGSWDAANKKIVLTGKGGTPDYLHFLAAGTGGNWQVMAPGTVNEVAFPAGVADDHLGDAAQVVSIQLKSGTTFQQLFEFGSGKNLDTLVQQVAEFSLADLSPKKP